MTVDEIRLRIITARLNKNTAAESLFVIKHVKMNKTKVQKQCVLQLYR